MELDLPDDVAAELRNEDLTAKVKESFWNSFANTGSPKGRLPNYLAYTGAICFR